jgi:glycerol-3-phosphate dehydrogenase
VLADAVERSGSSAADLTAPVAEGVPVTRAELLWGVTAEGALDVDDLLDRRTRVGLVPGDRAAAVASARWALEVGTRTS